MDKSFSVTLDNVSYGRIKDGFFEVKRHEQDLKIKDNQVELTTSTAYPGKGIVKKKIVFEFDPENKTLTRDDGTVFTLEEETE
ncbi:hypothetical protein [Sodalis sp. RH19]|uniref:hypothetical protein n=1 Tax=Sodalis sp. RH19 TaxID=3394334 RepID=UPI0039B50026